MRFFVDRVSRHTLFPRDLPGPRTTVDIFPTSSTLGRRQRSLEGRRIVAFVGKSAHHFPRILDRAVNRIRIAGIIGKVTAYPAARDGDGSFPNPVAATFVFAGTRGLGAAPDLPRAVEFGGGDQRGIGVDVAATAQSAAHNDDTGILVFMLLPAEATLS